MMLSPSMASYHTPFSETNLVDTKFGRTSPRLRQTYRILYRAFLCSYEAWVPLGVAQLWSGFQTCLSLMYCVESIRSRGFWICFFNFQTLVTVNGLADSHNINMSLCQMAKTLWTWSIFKAYFMLAQQFPGKAMYRYAIDTLFGW